MEEEVDLGLSLGLGGASGSHCNRQPRPPQLSQVPSLVAAPSPSMLLAAHRRTPATGPQWCDLLASSSSDGRRSRSRSTFLMGIDVNRAPATGHLEPDDEEEEDGVSSPNSTVSSSVSGGGGAGHNRSRGDGEHQPNGSGGDENELERALARVTSDEEDGGEGSRNKKLRLSKEQAAVLEESFKEHHTLNPRQKLALAKQLSLRPRQVEVWFQNRRARTKLKQTEVDCELLRRCCEGLTEENRRLHKEVQELRALKLLSPQRYMHMAPPTTLTICPSCERVAAVSSAPNQTSGAGAVLGSRLGPPPAAGAGGHDHLQHRLRPHVLPPRHLHPSPRRPVPVPSAGLPLPWAPAALRTPTFVDAPPPR